MWNELTFLWNELTILWNDLTTDWNDLTMGRNDRIPILNHAYFSSAQAAAIASSASSNLAAGKFRL